MKTVRKGPKDAQTTDGIERAGHERKQRWKSRPANRYTAKELRRMSRSLGRIQIHPLEFHVMKLT